MTGAHKHEPGSRLVGEREERLRGENARLRDELRALRPVLDEVKPRPDELIVRVDAALASSPSPPEDASEVGASAEGPTEAGVLLELDGAECHELYSMWLAHNPGEGVDPGHPLVTAGEKLAQRMDPEHPRFSAALPDREQAVEKVMRCLDDDDPPHEDYRQDAEEIVTALFGPVRGDEE